MKDSLNLADFRKFDPAALKIHGVVLWYLKGLYRVLLRFESWKSFLLAEEPGECIVEILVCILKRL